MKHLVCLGILIAATQIVGGARASANGSRSAHYVIVIDAVAGGGGSSASTHYRLQDSSIGQDSVAGPSSSGTKRENSGVIQYWSSNKNSARDWTCYE
ncbi:MAG: hypothetical protein ABFD69_11295 [Candidatus Sumerlaeia bacterium]